MQRPVRPTGARRGKDRADQGVRGIAHFVMLEAVAIAFKLDHLLVEWRRFVVHHPAVDDHAVIGLGNAQRRVLRGRRRKGTLVYPGHVAGVQQVVAHQQIIALQLHRGTHIDAPVGAVKIRDVDNFFRVCHGRVAHPDPHQAVFLVDRIRPHLGCRGDAPATGRPDTLPGAIKGQAMIAAFHRVALDPSL